jgi:hypothetical protein
MQAGRSVDDLQFTGGLSGDVLLDVPVGRDSAVAATNTCCPTRTARLQPIVGSSEAGADVLRQARRAYAGYVSVFARAAAPFKPCRGVPRARRG